MYEPLTDEENVEIEETATQAAITAAAAANRAKAPAPSVAPEAGAAVSLLPGASETSLSPGASESRAKGQKLQTVRSGQELKPDDSGGGGPTGAIPSTWPLRAVEASTF